MNRFLIDKLTGVLAFLTFVSYFFARDFFYGLLLFFINYISFKIIIVLLFQLATDDNNSIRKYIFIPTVIAKMLSIGGISYLVLVYLDGNPYFYMGGFGFGLAIFTLGTSISNISKREVAHKEK
jgi:hypothetical protein